MNTTITETFEVAGFDTVNKIDNDRKLRAVHHQGTDKNYPYNDSFEVDREIIDIDYTYHVNTLRFAGRYLKNVPDNSATDKKPLDKEMTEKEVAFLCRSGLGIVSIWQWSGSDPDELNTEGKLHARNAIDRATTFGQHKKTPIFFAFEYVKKNVGNPEPASLAETYFAAIHSIFSSSDENPNGYKMGIYSYGAILRHIRKKYPDIYTFCTGSIGADGNGLNGETFTDWDIKQSCDQFITNSQDSGPKMQVDWIMLPENSKKGECTWKHELKVGEIDDQKHRYFCTSADCGVNGGFTYDEEHTYSGNWKADDDAYHSDSCTVCTHKRRRLHTYGEYSRLDENHHSRTCTVCGHMKIEDHSFPSEWTSNGSEGHKRKCSHCEEEQNQPHTLKYTCNAAQHKCECTVCGYTEEANHVFGNWVKYNDSRHVRTCKVCGYSEIADHNFETWEYNDANTHKRLCPICNWSQVKSHEYGEWTMTRDSHHSHSCSKCGHTETQDHNFGPWQESGASTHVRRCIDCDYPESAGHNFNEWVHDPAVPDKHKRTCAVCKRIERQDHSFGNCTNQGSEGHTHTCSACHHEGLEGHSIGYKRKDHVVHEKYCTKCSYSTIEDHIPNVAGTKCTKCGSTIERPTPIDSTEDETE